MNRTISLLFPLCTLGACAQTEHLPPRPVAVESLPANNGSLSRVESHPQFPGGDQALAEFLTTNVHYPEELQKAHVSGTVKVAFTVADDGQVQNARIHSGIPKGEGLELEALRVVNAMPRWEPARVNGVAVPMDYLLPVTFALEEKH